MGDFMHYKANLFKFLRLTWNMHRAGADDLRKMLDSVTRTGMGLAKEFDNTTWFGRWETRFFKQLLMEKLEKLSSKAKKTPLDVCNCNHQRNMHDKRGKCLVVHDGDETSIHCTCKRFQERPGEWRGMKNA
jgi:hypothetical protein